MTGWATAALGRSEPGGVELHGRAVAGGEQVEQRADLGQLAREEVAGRRPLALVEGALLAARCQPLLQPQPGDHQVTGRLEVRRGVGEDQPRVAEPGQHAGHLHQPLGRRPQRGAVARTLLRQRRGPVRGGAHPLEEQRQPRAAVEHHLAAEQVLGLDPVGPLVDRVEPVVAVVLLDVEVAGVAGAAEHLDRQVVRGQAPLRRPALRDRRQHPQQRLGLLGGTGVVEGRDVVDQP